MKKEDFLKLMDGIDDRLVEKYALCQKSIQLKRANYFTHWNYGTKKFKKNH